MAQAQMIDGETGGPAQIGTKCLDFTPTKLVDKDVFHADAKTAGSIGLMAQVALPIAAFMTRKSDRQVKLNLRGGTDCDFAPPVRIQDSIFGRILEHYGIRLNIDQVRNGFFPVGKGESVFTIQNGEKRPLETFEEEINVELWYSVDKKSAKVENTVLDELNKAKSELTSLKHENLASVNFSVKREKRPGIGIAAGIYATFAYRSVTWLAKFNRKMEMSKFQASSMIDEIMQILDLTKSELPVLDRHHADQILVYGALSSGQTKFISAPENDQIPSHVLTAQYVINLMCGENTVLIDNFTVTVNGLSLI